MGLLTYLIRPINLEHFVVLLIMVNVVFSFLAKMYAFLASPEMINGKKYTGPEVDIWSMGVILFTLLGGYLPFHDQNTPELFKRISSANYKIPDYFSECIEY